MPIVDLSRESLDESESLGTGSPVIGDADLSPMDTEMDKGLASYRKIQDYSSRHRQMLRESGITSISSPAEADRSDWIIEQAEKANINKITNNQLFGGEIISTEADGIPEYMRGKRLDYISPILKSSMESIATFGLESSRGLAKFAMNPIARVNQLLAPVGVKLPEVKTASAMGMAEGIAQDMTGAKDISGTEIADALYAKLGQPTTLETSISEDRAEAINKYIEEGDWKNAYGNVALNATTDLAVWLTAMATATGAKFPPTSGNFKWAEELVNTLVEGGKFASFEAIRNPNEEDDYRKMVYMASAYAVLPYLGRTGAGALAKAQGTATNNATTAVLTMLSALGMQTGTEEIQDAVQRGNEKAMADGKPEEAVKYEVLELIPLLENDLAMGLMSRASRGRNDPETILKNEENIKESVKSNKGATNENATIPSKTTETGNVPKQDNGTAQLQPEQQTQKTQGVEATPSQIPSEAIKPEKTALDKPEMASKPITDDPVITTPAELIDRINQFPSKFNGIFDRIVSYAEGSENFRKGRQQQLAQDLMDASEYLPDALRDRVDKLVGMTYEKPNITANDLMDASLITLKGITKLKNDYKRMKLMEQGATREQSLRQQIRDLKQNAKDVTSAKVNLMSILNEAVKDNDFASTRYGGIAKRIMQTSKDFGKRVEEIQKYSEWLDRKDAVNKLKQNISRAKNKGAKYFSEFKDGVEQMVNDIDLRSKEKVDLYEVSYENAKKKMVDVNKPVAGIDNFIKSFEGNGATRLADAGLDMSVVAEKVADISSVKNKPFSQWDADNVKNLSDLLGILHKADAVLKKGATEMYENELAFRKAQAVIDSDARPSWLVGKDNPVDKSAPYTSNTLKDWTIGMQSNFDTELMSIFGKKSPTYQFLSRKLYDMPNEHARGVFYLMKDFMGKLKKYGFTDEDFAKIPNMSYRFTGIMPKILGTKMRTFKLGEGEGARELKVTPAEAVTLRLLARSSKTREFLLKGEQGVGNEPVAFETLKNKPERALTQDEMNYLLSDEFYKSAGTNREGAYKALENAIWDFNNTTMKDFGNRASERIEGYERFTDDEYVHVQRKGDYSKANKPEVADIMSSGWKPNITLPESAGRFKSKVKGANARMVLYDAFADLEQSIGQFARYNAFGEGLHQMRSILTDPSLVDSIRRNMGEDAWNRVKKHMNRISGENSAIGAIPFLSWNGLSGNITKSLVQWSPTALAVQPSAIFTAIPEVGAWNMTTGLKNYATDATFRRLYKDVVDNSALVSERKNGHLIGTEIGRLGKSVEMQEQLTGKSTWATKEGAMMRMMDGTSISTALIGKLQDSLAKRGMSAEDFYKLPQEQRAKVLDEMGYEAWQSLLNGGQALYNTEAQSLWQGANNPLMKVLGAFHSPIDQLVSRQYRNWAEFTQSDRTASDIGKFVYDSTMTYMAPAIFGAVVRSQIQYFKQNQDKREKMLEKDKTIPFTDIQISELEKKALINTLAEVVGQQYIIGDAVKGVLNMYIYGRGFGGGTNSPLLDSVNDLSVFAYDLANAVTADWNELSKEERTDKAKKLGERFARGIGKATGHSIQGWIDFVKLGEGMAEESGIKKSE